LGVEPPLLAPPLLLRGLRPPEFDPVFLLALPLRESFVGVPNPLLVPLLLLLLPRPLLLPLYSTT
jgi:hypothetical protein